MERVSLDHVHSRLLPRGWGVGILVGLVVSAVSVVVPDRGLLEVVNKAGTRGDYFEVFSPFWPGVVVGALLVGVSVAGWLLQRSRPAVLAAGAATAATVTGGAWLSTLVHLASQGSWIEGRPCRHDDGRLDLPAQSGATATLSPVVAYWREAARHEASSVGTFEVLADRLTSFGANEDLAVRCWRAADDERRHATLCTAIAEGLNGGPIGDLDAEWRPSSQVAEDSLERLATEAFVHGAIGEAFSAAILRAGAGSAAPELEVLIRSLANDEDEHAELAKDTIRWCLARGDERVHLALSAAMDAVAEEPHYPSLLVGVVIDDLRVGGLLSESETVDLWRIVRQESINFLRSELAKTS